MKTLDFTREKRELFKMCLREHKTSEIFGCSEYIWGGEVNIERRKIQKKKKIKMVHIYK